MRAFWLLPILALILCLGACAGADDDDEVAPASDDDTEDTDENFTGEPIDWPPTEADDDEYAETCPDGPVFAFHHDFTPMVVPYPNDLYTVADSSSPTGRRVAIDGQTARPVGKIAAKDILFFMTDAINTMNGFATLGELFLPSGAPIDSDTLPRNETPAWSDGIVLFVDDADSPFDGELHPLQARLVNGVVHLRPPVPLHEHTHYVLAATRRLTPHDGACYRASPTMRAIWRATEQGEVDDPRHLRYVDPLRRLAAHGVTAGEVLAIAEFTTLIATDGLNDMRRQLDALAAEVQPQLTDWDIRPTDDEFAFAHAYATLSTPIFQDENGHWHRDADGDWIVQEWRDLPILFGLPRPEAGPYEQPLPLVLYGHPITERKEGLIYFQLSRDYAKQGFGVVGMDSVCHGDRAPWPGDRISALLCYLAFLNPLKFRDNVRESMANELWLVHALRNWGDTDIVPAGGDGVPDFDPTSLYYQSISLNSIQGGLFASLAEHIDAYVLNVAGAKWTGVALEGPFLHILVQLARIVDGLWSDYAAEELVWTMGAMYQHVLDAAEPANFLVHLWRDEPLEGLEEHHPSILQQGGSSDFIIGGASGAYLCRAGGWPQLEPYVWDVGWVDHTTFPHAGSGFFQAPTANHVAFIGFGPLRDIWRRQAFAYFRSHYENGQAVIIDPRP